MTRNRWAAIAVAWSFVLLAIAPASGQTQVGRRDILLGINIREAASMEARQLGVNADSGAVITRVFANSPAAAAGLRTGDVVVRCGDVEIRRCADLERVVRAGKVGDQLSFGVQRGVSSQRIAVVLGGKKVSAGSAAGEIYLGVRLRSAGHPEAKALGIESPLGAVVMHATPNAPAAQAGLRRGDRIVEFSGHEIQVYEDLESAARRAGQGSRNSVVYIRGLQRIQTTLIIGSRPRQAAPVLYEHPSKAFQIDLPRGWGFLRPRPSASPADAAHDEIRSTEGAYTFHVYRSSWPGPNAPQILNAFASATMTESPRARRGEFRVGQAPAVYVAYPFGTNPRQMLFRISWVHAQKRYVIDAYAPPLAQVDKLPLPIKDLMDRIRFVESAGPSDMGPSSRPPLNQPPRIKTPPVLEQHAQQVDPSQYPQLIHWGDKLSVAIPPSALRKSETLKIGRVANKAATNLSPKMPVRCLGAFDVKLGARREFDDPLLFTMPYNPALIRPGTSAAEQIVAGRWDEAARRWVLLPTWVSEKDHRLVFQSDHLSIVAGLLISMAAIDRAHASYEWAFLDLHSSEHCTVIYDRAALQKSSSLSDAAWKGYGGGRETGIRWFNARWYQNEYPGTKSLRGTPDQELPELLRRLAPSDRYVNGYRPGVPLVVQDVASFMDRAYRSCRDFKRPQGRVVVKIGSNWAEFYNAPSQFESVYDRVHLSASSPTSLDKIKRQTAHEFFHAVQHESFGHLSMTPVFTDQYQWFLESTAEYAACNFIWRSVDKMAGRDNPPYGVNPRLCRYSLRDYGADPLGVTEYEDLGYDKAFFIDYLVRQRVPFEWIYRRVAGSRSLDLIPPLSKTINDATGKGLNEHYRGFAREFLLGLRSPVAHHDPAQKCAEKLDRLAFVSSGGASAAKTFEFNLPREYSARLWALQVEPDPTQADKPRQVMVRPLKMDEGVILEVHLLKGNRRAVGDPKPVRVFTKTSDAAMVNVSPDDALYVLAVNLHRDRDAQAKVEVSDAAVKLTIEPDKVEDDSGKRTFTFKGMAEGIPDVVKRVAYKWSFGNEESVGLTTYPHPVTSNIEFSRIHQFPDHGQYAVKLELYDITVGRSLLATAEAPVRLGSQISLTLDPPITVAEPGGEIPFVVRVDFAPRQLVYLWDFGDGTPTQTTTMPEARHAFAQEDVFPVTVRIATPDKPKVWLAKATGVAIIETEKPPSEQVARLQKMNRVRIEFESPTSSTYDVTSTRTPLNGDEAKIRTLSGGSTFRQIFSSGEIPITWAGTAFRGVQKTDAKGSQASVVGYFDPQVRKLAMLVISYHQNTIAPQELTFNGQTKTLEIGNVRKWRFNAHQLLVDGFADGDSFQCRLQGKAAANGITGLEDFYIRKSLPPNSQNHHTEQFRVRPFRWTERSTVGAYFSQATP